MKFDLRVVWAAKLLYPSPLHELRWMGWGGPDVPTSPALPLDNLSPHRVQCDHDQAPRQVRT